MASRWREVREAQLEIREATLRDWEATLRDWEAKLRNRDATLRDREAKLRDLEAKLRNQETSCVRGTFEGWAGACVILGFGLLVVGGAIHAMMKRDNERSENRRRPRNNATWGSGVYDGYDESGYMLPRRSPVVGSYPK